MRVLIDESLPKALIRALPGHDVATVRQMRWDGLRNGVLLQRATEAGFDAIVTADRSMEFQQNLSRFGLGLVVIESPTNRVPAILGLAPKVLTALLDLGPGIVVHVASGEPTR